MKLVGVPPPPPVVPPPVVPPPVPPEPPPVSSPGPGTSQPVAPVKPAALIVTSAQFQKTSGYVSAEFAVKYVHCRTQRSHSMSAGTLRTIVYVETVWIRTRPMRTRRRTGPCSLGPRAVAAVVAAGPCGQSFCGVFDVASGKPADGLAFVGVPVVASPPVYGHLYRPPSSCQLPSPFMPA